MQLHQKHMKTFHPDLYMWSFISQHLRTFSVQILLFRSALSQITVFLRLNMWSRSNARSYIITNFSNQVWIWLYQHILANFNSFKDWKVCDLPKIFGCKPAKATTVTAKNQRVQSCLTQSALYVSISVSQKFSTLGFTNTGRKLSFQFSSVFRFSFFKKFLKV